jgi:peptidoglycan/xylan/chitin deacetylase (PgdA/CDA1 family)
MLTFDDAYADLCQHAFPILERHGFGAGVFVVTDRLAGLNTWDQLRDAESFPLMSADEIRSWAKRGIEFGAHTRTHPDLATLAPADQEREIEGSAADLERILGARPASFSYPYGSYDEHAVRAARERFALAFAVEEGVAAMDRDPWRLRRFMAHRYDQPRDLLLAFRLGRNPKAELRRLLRGSRRVHYLGRRVGSALRSR